jgi:hypothetical protein
LAVIFEKSEELMELIPFVELELWGLMNYSSEIIVPPKFLKIELLNNGFAIVCTEKKPDRKFYSDENSSNYNGTYDLIWGMINEKGNFVIEPNYTHLEIISNCYASGILYAGPGKKWTDYCQNSEFAINYNSENSKLLGRFREIKIMENGFCLVESGRDPAGKDYCWLTYQIFNKVGVNIIEFSGGSILSDFEKGVIKLGNNQKTTFYNENGSLIKEINISIKDISKNLGNHYIYKENNHFFFLNLETKEIRKLSSDIDLVWNDIQSINYIETNASY